MQAGSRKWEVMLRSRPIANQLPNKPVPATPATPPRPPPRPTPLPHTCALNCRSLGVYQKVYTHHRPVLQACPPPHLTPTRPTTPPHTCALNCRSLDVYQQVYTHHRSVLPACPPPPPHTPAPHLCAELQVIGCVPAGVHLCDGAFKTADVGRGLRTAVRLGPADVHRLQYRSQLGAGAECGERRLKGCTSAGRGVWECQADGVLRRRRRLGCSGHGGRG